MQAWRSSHTNADKAKLGELDREGWAGGTLHLLASYTGLRAKECRTLRWADVILDGDEPHVVVRAANA